MKKTMSIFVLVGLSAGAQETAYFKTGPVEFDGKVVTGAPYTAQAQTETTQTLADGNRITRTITSSISRDSMGRTRREQTFGVVGPWSTSGKPASMIMINDPVEGVRYTLEPDSKTAVKMPAMSLQLRRDVDVAKLKAESDAITRTFVIRDDAAPGISVQALKARAENAATSESLGTKMISGVQAEGKRVTETIPAGAIGNERAIEVVNETWYSPELQTVVMSKHSDPRTGDVTYTLTNLSRAEPDPALFTVPPDYKLLSPSLKDDGRGIEMRR